MAYIPMMYLHLLAGAIITFASSEDTLSDTTGYSIAVAILSFVLLLTLLFLPPSPLKYLVAALYCAALGQTMYHLFQTLKQKDLVRPVLVSVCSIFAAMTVAGFLDQQNLLGFGGYLFAALCGLLLARIGLILFAVTGATDSLTSANQLLSLLGTGLFSIYVAYDTQRLKADAKRRQKNPDYIEATISLYLDLLNLFVNVADLMDH